MIALFALALFSSAALLFLLEPLAGNLVLPLLGSTPQVWSTTLLFFQAALLVGYAYSHWSSLWLGVRRQAALQVMLLVAAALALPIALPAGAHPPTTSTPIPWLLILLVGMVGLPFAVLAATGPMLQRWLAAADRSRNPYVLFAASNSGSLLGLIAYPLVLQPLFTVGAQGRAWSLGYGVTAVLVVAAASTVWRRAPAGPAPAARVAGTPPTRRARAAWVALAGVASSLMLGTTTFITRDLAPVPLLWVAPLALYLLTFVVVFAPPARPHRLVAGARLALPALVIVLVYTLALGSQRPLWLLLTLHLLTLAAAGVLCHGRLAAERPPPQALTGFYLWVAVGGVLGGVFNALIAPLVFPTLIEYPLALVAVCLLRPPSRRPRPGLLELLLGDPRPTRWMDLAAPVLFGTALAVVFAAVSRSPGGLGFGPRSAILGVACGLAGNFARRPLRFGLGIAAILLAANVGSTGTGRILDRDRSFFGIYKVAALDTGRYHALYDGTTLHGIERVGESPPQPLSYYGRPGPAGQAFAELPAADGHRVGVIGLGAGALGCYARPGDHFTFYEVDPAVARIARNPALFTYLSGCPGIHDVVIGDGRRSLARAAPASFGIIAVDAFSSDAIPVNLITRQAVLAYASRLRPGGVVLFHISNRYLALEPVLGDIAHALGYACRAQRHTPTPAQQADQLSTSQWALLAPAATDLGRLATDARWHPCTRNAAAVWTDSYSNLLSVIKWG